jgi:hypothetical protein
VGFGAVPPSGPLSPNDGISRAEDGIRTRDPHLGKVVEIVHRVPSSRLSCSPIHGMSTGFA